MYIVQKKTQEFSSPFHRRCQRSLGGFFLSPLRNGSEEDPPTMLDRMLSRGERSTERKICQGQEDGEGSGDLEGQKVLRTVADSD